MTNEKNSVPLKALSFTIVLFAEHVFDFTEES